MHVIYIVIGIAQYIFGIQDGGQVLCIVSKLIVFSSRLVFENVEKRTKMYLEKLILLNARDFGKITNECYSLWANLNFEYKTLTGETRFVQLKVFKNTIICIKNKIFLKIYIIYLLFF